MTTKELLALVERWREDAARVRRIAAKMDSRGDCDAAAEMRTSAQDAEGYADELAPIATALCAEVEALRKDAERYRWLREKGLSFTHDAEHRGVSTMRWGEWDYDTPEGFAARIDAAIDAAKEPK